MRRVSGTFPGLVRERSAEDAPVAPPQPSLTTMYLQSRNAETQFGPRDLDWETVNLDSHTFLKLKGHPVFKHIFPYISSLVGGSQCSMN